MLNLVFRLKAKKKKEKEEKKKKEGYFGFELKVSRHTESFIVMLLVCSVVYVS